MEIVKLILEHPFTVAFLILMVGLAVLISRCNDY